MIDLFIQSVELQIVINSLKPHFVLFWKHSFKIKNCKYLNSISVTQLADVLTFIVSTRSYAPALENVTTLR